MSPARKNTDPDAAPDGGWTPEERAAMAERAAEVKAASRGRGKTDGAADLRAKIAEMAEPDRMLAERIAALVAASAPTLASRTWYGMPAWTRDGKVVCFFQAAAKFGTRYATFGFQHDALLDDGAVWPVAYAVTDLSDADADRLAALIRRAAG
ncbi:MAG: iron chaperone [Chloroflexota bacterium]